MASYTVYEVVTNEPWSDKTNSGTRVIRFKTNMPLAVALRSDPHYLLGLFAEYEPSANKGLGKWGLYREGAVAQDHIIRIIEVEDEQKR